MNPEVTTPCIEWTGAKTDKGYGWRAFRGTQMRAHRAAWIQAHGDISNGMIVCHKCDNPPCINIDHLYLGTGSSNMIDMRMRNRHPRQKLSAEQVSAMKKERESGATLPDLAKKYGVRKEHVCKICRGKIWKFHNE